MGVLSRIVVLCPLPQILWMQKTKQSNNNTTTHYRVQNRTLIKYKNKFYYLQITILALVTYGYYFINTVVWLIL